MIASQTSRGGSLRFVALRRAQHPGIWVDMFLTSTVV